MLSPDMSDIKQNIKNLSCAVTRCSYNFNKLGMLHLFNVWIAYAAHVLVLVVLNKLKVCLCIM